MARKALRVNLSDLAAKGAKPLGFLLSLALPKETGDGWLAGFAQGLREDADAFGCPLFGGDTDRTPGPITISIAMFGSVPEGTMVRRAGAKPGDRVFVSGTIGDAALGLVLRKGADWKLDAMRSASILLSRYLLPQPRNALGRGRAHACLGVDGCVRRPGRRFHQAVPGLASRGRDRGRARAAVGSGQGGGGRRSGHA